MPRRAAEAGVTEAVVATSKHPRPERVSAQCRQMRRILVVHSDGRMQALASDRESAKQPMISVHPPAWVQGSGHERRRGPSLADGI